MSRLRCALDTFWGTVTMDSFWTSLVNPPLVVFDGHIWPEPPEWSKPRYVEDTGRWIEYDVSRCVRCGQLADGWRSFAGVMP